MAGKKTRAGRLSSDPHPNVSRIFLTQLLGQKSVSEAPTSATAGYTFWCARLAEKRHSWSADPGVPGGLYGRVRGNVEHDQGIILHNLPEGGREALEILG
ncbi:hypothetical protein J6590_043357 [Homalodisca vitripennis]|nr:hypothetical protein J6590_043357 [Homalodisca vitripennis]